MNEALLDLYLPEALAAAGTVMHGPDLPYPPMPTPTYGEAEHGDWRFSQAILAAAPGYFTPPRVLMQSCAMLSRGGITWMSVTPCEVESQMPHLAAARGTVVVCGLGLGVMAYAVSALKAVNRVVVVEQDGEVIEACHRFAGIASWPQRGKLEIVQGDALAVRVDGVDFLYADIWPYYRMDCMIEDMKAIHANIPAPACGYWGQELDMVDAAIAQGVALEDFSAVHVEQFARGHGLPLIGLEQAVYPDLCRRAAVNPAIGGKRRP